MLPIRCIQPPCMNIDVNTVIHGDTSDSSGGSCPWPSSDAGTTPSA